MLVRIEGVAGRKVHQVYSHNQSLKLFSRQGLVADTARGGGPLDTRSPVRASKSSDGMGQLLSAVRALPSPDTLWKYEQLANEVCKVLGYRLVQIARHYPRVLCPFVFLRVDAGAPTPSNKVFIC